MEVNFTLQRYIYFDILQKKCLKFCGFLFVCEFFYNFATQIIFVRAHVKCTTCEKQSKK